METQRHHLPAGKTRADPVRVNPQRAGARARVCARAASRAARSAARKRTRAFDVETVELGGPAAEIAGNGDVGRCDSVVNAKVRRVVCRVARTARNQRERKGNCHRNQPGRLRPARSRKGPVNACADAFRAGTRNRTRDAPDLLFDRVGSLPVVRFRRNPAGSSRAAMRAICTCGLGAAIAGLTVFFIGSIGWLTPAGIGVALAAAGSPRRARYGASRPCARRVRARVWGR